MPITIRPLVEIDLPVADRILQAAFGRNQSFVEMLQLNGAAQPGNQLVAVRAGQVVGTVGAVNFGQFAYIALMGVDPAQQGRGIARRLMEHVLARLDDHGCPIVLLDATDVGAVLYEKLGFADDSSAYEFEGDNSLASNVASTLGSQRGPDSIRAKDSSLSTATRNLGVARMTDADLVEVIEFDLPRFGADRGQVLQILLNEFPERAFVCRDVTGQVTGYLFARTVLGPWVAANAATAEDLLAVARTLPSPEPLRVLVPRSNHAACDLLARNGLHSIRKLRHMRRGGTVPPGRPECLFGQVSFGLG
ncbi:MAG TPA: GNAT family N-acetyltransferase [Pirellulales bacterium]|jgi:predicted N-acetyltransferase YhbS